MQLDKGRAGVTGEASAHKYTDLVIAPPVHLIIIAAFIVLAAIVGSTQEVKAQSAEVYPIIDNQKAKNCALAIKYKTNTFGLTLDKVPAREQMDITPVVDLQFDHDMTDRLRLQDDPLNTLPPLFKRSPPYVYQGKWMQDGKIVNVTCIYRGEPTLLFIEAGFVNSPQ